MKVTLLLAFVILTLLPLALSKYNAGEHIVHVQFNPLVTTMTVAITNATSYTAIRMHKQLANSC